MDKEDINDIKEHLKILIKVTRALTKPLPTQKELQKSLQLLIRNTKALTKPFQKQSDVSNAEIMMVKRRIIKKLENKKIIRDGRSLIDFEDINSILIEELR